VPIHALTATLQPGQEYKVANALHLPLKSFRIIRACTDRPNLEYRVHKVTPKASSRESTAVSEKVVVEVRRADSKMSEGECGLIITRSKDQADQIGKRLGCLTYHAGFDPDHRNDTYAKWQKGKKANVDGSGWLASTTLIDTGNDTLKLTHTFFCEAPFHFESFLQGAGRTAREGQHGTVAIFFARYSSGKQVGELDQEFVGVKEMEAFLESGNECRRFQITRYSDGVGVVCSAVKDCRLCDVCEHRDTYRQMWEETTEEDRFPTVSAVEESFERYTVDQAGLTNDISKLKMLKSHIIPSHHCPFHYMLLGELSVHKSDDCDLRGDSGETLAKGKGTLLSKIEWLPRHTCWKCWFPHGGKIKELHLGKDWNHEEQGSAELGLECKEFVLCCLFAIFDSTSLRKELETRYRFQTIPKDLDRYANYFVQLTNNNGMTVAHAMIAKCLTLN
jgi:hypothetical protein